MFSAMFKLIVYYIPVATLKQQYMAISWWASYPAELMLYMGVVSWLDVEPTGPVIH